MSVVPPSYTVAVVDVESRCEPAFRTGIELLDSVLFCIGGYGITLAVVIIAFLVLLLLLR